jgi:predicted nucleic acid-binding protein
MTTPLRVLLDVNVWVANLMAAARGRQGTAVQRIVAMVTGGRWGDGAREAQLVVSLDMLATLETVLRRQGASSDAAEAYVEAIEGIMKHGPDELDPYLVLGGRDQFAMADVEDAGVLATAFAAKATLLVTDNLKDFQTRDALRIDTRVVRASSGSRQLYVLRHRRSDVDVIVAHPFDVVDWLDQRLDFQPDALWRTISSKPADRT